jgi:ribosomal-protein-alanine N-acetyltransferase
MTLALTIRKAGLMDIKAVWAIEKLSFPTPWTRWSFLSELGNPVSHFLVAGPAPPEPWELWGYLIFWLVYDELHILNLAVHPRHRRKGVGRRLLKEVLTRGRDLGAHTTWLEVRPSNHPARALYESFGFAEVGTRPRYYHDTQEDALILALSWEEGGVE